MKQHHLQQTAHQADWLIGARGLLAEGSHGDGLRSMSVPGTAYNNPMLGKDPQPANISGFVHTQEDNDGVHLNSGIHNRAFYLVSITLSGMAMPGKKRAPFGMLTLTDKQLLQNSSFADFSKLTLSRVVQRRDQKCGGRTV
ncbi:M4 family metallopeptidase [Sodalis-like endosymbiont of Proechinophthirus fluctus]|uniref:M4 family metallopeptidase n=1 Tax=Sodalis-like endosymbiont of Proechinophthirus fluctus TaxID=1462730 RepID=UPI00082E6C14